MIHSFRYSNDFSGMNQTCSVLSLETKEVELHPIRAQGPGGQHVNKVSTAIHLRFDIHASSLPDSMKAKLLNMHDQRISKDGVIVIKAQQRSQEKSREDAMSRLHAILQEANVTSKIRHATKPTRSSRKKRLEHKNSRSQIKATRSKVIC